MKNAKQLSNLFALLGAVLIVGTVALSFLSLNTAPHLVVASDDAEQCTQNFMDALCQEDYTAAGNLLLGQPNLAADQEPGSELGSLLWDTYSDSLSYEFVGECYATDAGLSRDVRITALDIPDVMAVLKERSESLLTQSVEVTDSEIVYDKDNNYREDFVMGVLLDGVIAILEEGYATTSREITLNLTFQNGQWWIQPEQALMNVISGGMGK